MFNNIHKGNFNTVLRAVRSRVFRYLIDNNIESYPQKKENKIMFRLFVNHSKVSVDPSRKLRDELMRLWVNGTLQKLPGLKKKTKKQRRVERENRKKKYEKYLKSAKWRALREKVFYFYGRECGLCGNKHNLEVHHKTYKNIFNEPISDLMVLCEPCHRNHHHKEKAKRKTGRSKHLEVVTYYPNVKRTKLNSSSNSSHHGPPQPSLPE